MRIARPPHHLATDGPRAGLAAARSLVIAAGPSARTPSRSAATPPN